MVKIASPDMAGFTKHLAIIPAQVMNSCKEMTDTLQASGVLKQQDFADAFLELESGPLSTAEVAAFFAWYVQIQKQFQIQQADRLRIQKALTWLESGVTRSLAAITHFTLKSFIPADLPLPLTVIPPVLTSKISTGNLRSCFWKWQELTLPEWTAFVVQEKDLKIPSFTEKVMQTISRHYVNISSTEKALVISILATQPCIVSSKGMVCPRNCYFPNVTLFADLPKVAFQKQLTKQFLIDLGMRKAVDLQLFFDRLDDLSWDQMQVSFY
jgi:Protein of unknown function (DUF3684)